MIKNGEKKKLIVGLLYKKPYLHISKIFPFHILDNDFFFASYLLLLFGFGDGEIWLWRKHYWIWIQQRTHHLRIVEVICHNLQSVFQCPQKSTLWKSENYQWIHYKLQIQGYWQGDPQHIPKHFLHKSTRKIRSQLSWLQ